jgi:hypothetical protein
MIYEALFVARWLHREVASAGALGGQSTLCQRVESARVSAGFGDCPVLFIMDA